MIDTKMKTMITGLGLVAMLGGCGRGAETTAETSKAPMIRVIEVEAPAICVSQMRVDIGTYGRTVIDHEPLIYCKDTSERDLACVKETWEDKYSCYTLKK